MVSAGSAEALGESARDSSGVFVLEVLYFGEFAAKDEANLSLPGRRRSFSGEGYLGSWLSGPLEY